MWLLIGVCASVLVLGLIGHTYPRLNNYSPPSSYQPLPDLRVSEFAPDLNAIPSEQQRAIANIKKKIDHRKLMEEEAQSRRYEAHVLVYKDYHDRVTEIKTRRWKEGNPVTKKNPIDPDEMPPNPSRYYF